MTTAHDADCDHCGQPINPDDPGDAGPSCASHLLHIDCGHLFGCTNCYQMRTEVCS